MRCAVPLLLTLGGCSFRAAGGELADADAAPGLRDAPSRDAAPPDPPDAAPPRCVGDGLVLCLPFGDQLTPTLALDGSGQGHDVAAANVDTATRHTAGDAAKLSATSTLYYADTTGAFELPLPLSYGAWVALPPAPAGEDRMTIIDANSHFGMFVYGANAGGGNDGKVYCFANGTTARTDAALNNAWHHVMCVMAGGKLSIYLDGALQEAKTLNALAPGSGDLCVGSNCDGDGPLTGSTADRLVGAIDHVTIWSRGLSAAEVCLEAEQDACN